MALKNVFTYIFGSAGIVGTGLAYYTFWWNNLKKGQVSVRIPRSYGAYQNDRFVLLLPLSITNTGARVKDISQLRIRIGTPPVNAVYVRTRPEMRLDSQPFEFAINFSIPGRTTILRVCEFESPEPASPLHVGLNDITLEMQTEELCDWEQIAEFEIHVADDYALQTIRTRYVVHDNAPALPGEPSTTI